MNADQQKAFCELAKHGPLTDPQYMSNPAKAEGELKVAVKSAWQYREHFPRWVEGYVEKWAAEKNGTAREPYSKAQRRASQVNHGTGLPANAARGVESVGMNGVKRLTDG